MNSRYNALVPDYAHRAFERLYLYGLDDEKYEAFASRWGGCEYEHFLRALQDGEGDDHLCAMFAVGASTHPEAASVLLPFLRSDQRDERVVSAIVLGMRQDTRAYPFVERLVLEGLSLDERQQVFAGNDQKAQEDLFLCDRFRPRAVQLLDTWHSPTLLPTLLQALQDLWKWEQHSSRWFAQADAYKELLYALGQRGVFPALDTLDFPPVFQRIARVHFTLGALQVKPARTLMRWVLGNTERVKRFLEENFQLDEEEAQQDIHTFYGENEALRSYRERLNEQVKGDRPAEPLLVPQDVAQNEAIGATGEHTAEEETIVQREAVLLWRNEQHTDIIWSLAWSPDGIHLASGSQDGTVQICNGHTGEPIRIFKGHRACVTAVVWSPDGQWIASGGCDTTVLVWHAWTGSIATTYTQHSTWICQGLAWSPDGTTIASGSWDKQVHIWEAMTGKTRVRYREHCSVVTALAWSPDGTRVVSGEGCPDCAVHVWEAFTGHQLLLYRDHMPDTVGTRPIEEASDPDSEAWQRGPSSVRSLAWSPDGRWIASAGQRAVFRVWDAQTGEDLIAKVLHQLSEQLAWSPDSTSVALGQYNSIDFWNIATKRILFNYRPLRSFRLTDLAWAPDRKVIATADERNPYICVWKVDSGEAGG